MICKSTRFAGIIAFGLSMLLSLIADGQSLPIPAEPYCNCFEGARDTAVDGCQCVCPSTTPAPYCKSSTDGNYDVLIAHYDLPQPVNFTSAVFEQEMRSALGLGVNSSGLSYVIIVPVGDPFDFRRHYVGLLVTRWTMSLTVMQRFLTGVRDNAAWVRPAGIVSASNMERDVAPRSDMAGAKLWSVDAGDFGSVDVGINTAGWFIGVFILMFVLCLECCCCVSNTEKTVIEKNEAELVASQRSMGSMNEKFRARLEEKRAEHSQNGNYGLSGDDSEMMAVHGTAVNVRTASPASPNRPPRSGSLSGSASFGHSGSPKGAPPGFERTGSRGGYRADMESSRREAELQEDGDAPITIDPTEGSNPFEPPSEQSGESKEAAPIPAEAQYSPREE